MVESLDGPFGFVNTNRRSFIAFVLASGLAGIMSSMIGFPSLTRFAWWRPTRNIIPQSRKASLGKVLELPLEVLIEILSLLEWNEVLRVRQTCRRFRDASLARPVWLSLVKWYSATVEPRQLWPEKPLDLYTDRELERLILRWQNAEVGWTLSQDRPFPKQRNFSISRKPSFCMHIIEGGRWLIFGAHCGSVNYYDLDALGDSAVTLVPTLFDEDARTEIMLSIDMDSYAESLTFNIGIVTRRRPFTVDSDLQDLPRWIQVCRVTSDINENGQVRGLRAERLACFREDYWCSFDSFTLQGCHVAYSVFASPNGGALGHGDNIIIVDWMTCDSMSLTFPRKVIWRTRAEWMTLLPGNVLLCHSGISFLLFDFSNAPVTTFIPTRRLPNLTELEPVAYFPVMVDAVSPPYLVQNSTRVSFLTRRGVHGLVVPRSNDVSLTTMKCIDLLSDENLCTSVHRIGYNHATLVEWPELTTVQFAWPGDPSCSLVSRKHITPISNDGYPSDVVFDQSSGRIVITGNMLSTQYVLDLTAL